MLRCAARHAGRCIAWTLRTGLRLPGRLESSNPAYSRTQSSNQFTRCKDGMQPKGHHRQRSLSAQACVHGSSLPRMAATWQRAPCKALRALSHRLRRHCRYRVVGRRTHLGLRRNSPLCTLNHSMPGSPVASGDPRKLRGGTSRATPPSPAPGTRGTSQWCRIPQANGVTSRGWHR